MKAKEARNKAVEVNTNKATSQYAQILALISNAASKGEYELWYYENIKDDVKDKLFGDGYDVGVTSFERNEVTTRIKW